MFNDTGLIDSGLYGFLWSHFWSIGSCSSNRLIILEPLRISQNIALMTIVVQYLHVYLS
jgi:hypothetical protein